MKKEQNKTNISFLALTFIIVLIGLISFTLFPQLNKIQAEDNNNCNQYNEESKCIENGCVYAEIEECKRVGEYVTVDNKSLCGSDTNCVSKQIQCNYFYQTFEGRCNDFGCQAPDDNSNGWCTGGDSNIVQCQSYKVGQCVERNGNTPSPNPTGGSTTGDNVSPHCDWCKDPVKYVKIPGGLTPKPEWNNLCGEDKYGDQKECYVKSNNGGGEGGSSSCKKTKQNKKTYVWDKNSNSCSLLIKDETVNCGKCNPKNDCSPSNGKRVDCGACYCEKRTHQLSHQPPLPLQPQTKLLLLLYPTTQRT